MPDLSQSLQGRDLGHLRIVAELWGIELNAPDTRVAFQRLPPAMLNARRAKAVLDNLPPQATTALQDLMQNEGRLPWPQFIRRHGAVREIGPARRDRERPHLAPSSAAEALWYRALVGRAFFDTPQGPVEFAYIPDDLLPLIPASIGPGKPSLGRPATPKERAQPRPASDRLLDQACTFLAARRAGLPVPGIQGPAGLPELTEAALEGLLAAAGLVDDAGLPLPEPTRLFLEAPRGEALAMLAQAWRESPTFNDLRLVPHLRAEGEWKNNPLHARKAVLDFVLQTPTGTWWSLAAFVAAVRQQAPDFQRPAGDYDSWFLRDLRAGEEAEYLRGFEHWDDVDGALVRYLVCGPLHWLGVLDLAVPTASEGTDPKASTISAPSAFRFTPGGKGLLAGKAPVGLPVEDKPILARSDARLTAPRLAPRPARYQLARFCEWLGQRGDDYLYRVTPISLGRARQQGLTTGHLLTLLRRYAQPVPPALIKSLERWETHGTEARFERLLVLRLASPDLLQTLRSSKAARFLGDPLGPISVVVKPGALEKVQAVLAELGFLGEVLGEPEPPSQDA